MKTKLLHIVAVFTSAGILSACESSSYNETATVSFTLPDRHILALSDKRLFAEIDVNNGITQKFFVEPDQTTIDIAVEGIRDNQNNTIYVLWSAIHNDRAVEVAIQSQEFYGRGNIVINAPHSSDNFDYDGDGMSNLAELVSGKCVWYIGSQCFLNGVLDKPTSPALSQGQIPDYSFDYENADDILANGDFSRGAEGWVTEHAKLASVDSHLCSTMQAGPFPVQHPVLYSFIDLEPGDYMIEFDVKTTRQYAALNVQLYSSAIARVVLYQFVEPLTLDWTRRQIKYTYTGGRDRFSIEFSAVINRSQTTTFCFDNIAVLKAQ